MVGTGAARPGRRRRRRGVEVLGRAGNSWLDFSSQLVNVNIGHQHPKLVAAIKEQADKLCTVAPIHANDARSEAARLIAELAPGDLNKVFFTNGGAEATENAIRMARGHTGRLKVLTTYRSYHGSTSGAITMTGDPRRWANEPGMPGVVKFWGPYPYRSAFHAGDEAEECERALGHLADVIMVEGGHTIAAIVLETVVGTNGILVPPDGYLAGRPGPVRPARDRDDRRRGDGRVRPVRRVVRRRPLGRRPRPHRLRQGRQLRLRPARRRGHQRARSPRPSPTQAYQGGLTYSGHPLACASAVASINIFKEEGIIEHARHLGDDIVGPALAEIAERHPSVGEVRGLGVFWAIELVRDRETREPLVPYNASGPANAPMAEFAGACKDRGLWPFTHFNRTHVVPPLTISDDEMREGLAIIDEALAVADKHPSPPDHECRRRELRALVRAASRPRGRTRMNGGLIGRCRCAVGHRHGLPDGVAGDPRRPFGAVAAARRLRPRPARRAGRLAAPRASAGRRPAGSS